MSAPANAADWFIDDGEQQHGPMREPEMRQFLLQHPDDSLRVRQGRSEWVGAETVRRKYAQLAESGIYFRHQDRQIEGPFTAARAFELLQAMDRSTVESRVGRNGTWLPAGRLFGRLSRLIEAQQRHRAEAKAASAPAEASDDLPMAVVIEEPIFVEAVPVEPESSEPSPSERAEVVEVTAVPVEPVRTVVDPPAAPRSSVPMRPTNPRAVSKSRNARKWIVVAAVGGAGVLLLLVGGGLYGLYRWNGEAPEANATEATPGRLTTNAVQRTHGVPPAVRPGTLFRPTFRMRSSDVNAGTAFAARLATAGESTDTVVLSALHLLGPAGGLPADVPAGQVPNLWQGLSLVDCRSGQTIDEVLGQPLSLPATKPFPEASPTGDVIAYRVDGGERFQPYVLAEEDPQPGDPVWLVSEVIGTTRLIHPAHVLGEDSGWLAYEFVDANAQLRATSGAPVVNAAHEVVAVNAGGGSEGGRTIGLGTPVSKFRQPLAGALKANP